jgi:predicted CopG family antitoxin
MLSCMATKTISLELDAYERLKRAKRGKESFSSVVRRARFDAPESTGSAILEEVRALYSAQKCVSKKTFDYWEQVEAGETDNPRVSASKWVADA